MVKSVMVQCVQCDVRYSKKYNSECPRCRSRIVKEDYPQTLSAVLAKKTKKYACSTCSFESTEPYCEVCTTYSSMIRIEDVPPNRCKVCGDLTHSSEEYCTECEYEWRMEGMCKFCGDMIDKSEDYCTHCLQMKRDKQDKAAKDVGSLAASLMEVDEESEISVWARSINQYTHKGPRKKGMGGLMEAQEELRDKIRLVNKDRL